jgi:hypothetical protein
MNQENSEDSILDRICIAMPCSVDWNDMKGDNKVRLCGGCNKDVYNLSALSKKEAEEVLSRPTLPCIQIARTKDGAIVTEDRTISTDETSSGTEEKSNPIRYFWSYGKTAVSAILSLIATLAPQWASAADEKNKPMLRGRPALITPQVKEPTKQLTTPLPPGMPIYIPRAQSAAAFWPSSITGLGFSSDDLPLTISEKFSAEQFKTVESKKMDLGTVPPQLDKKAWELFFKARKLHLKAAMHLVNKEVDDAMKDCQAAQKQYQLALEQISRGRHDDAFAALVYGEQNKISQLAEQARKCQGSAPKQK